MIEVFYKVQQRLLEDFTKKWKQPDYHLWLQNGTTNESRSNRHDDAKASDQVHSRCNARDDTERDTAKGSEHVRRNASQKYSDACAGRNPASNVEQVNLNLQKAQVLENSNAWQKNIV